MTSLVIQLVRLPRPALFRITDAFQVAPRRFAALWGAQKTRKTGACKHYDFIEQASMSREMYRL